MSYCATTDLLTGNIPTPGYMSPQKIVDDAADEIDSRIGFVYETPVVFPLTPESRPARLLFKRINAHLATGRLLMEVAAAQEDDSLNAYAVNLINSSLAAIEQIATRAIKIDDAVPLPGQETVTTGPLQYNKDSESQTDAFYDRVLFAPPSVSVRPYYGG